jgi:hypothetical protein
MIVGLLGCAMLSGTMTGVVAVFWVDLSFRDAGHKGSIVVVCVKAVSGVFLWLFLAWLLRFGLVLTALLQYPLHLYMVIAIRQSNKRSLGGDGENTWGFGQVVALVLLVPVFKEILAELLSMSIGTKYYLRGPGTDSNRICRRKRRQGQQESREADEGHDRREGVLRSRNSVADGVERTT